MDMNEAMQLVANDVMPNWPDGEMDTVEKAIKHVRNVLNVEMLDGEPGQPLYEAYKMVLTGEETFMEPGADTPESIRQFRERLGLSRRDVEIGTKLSSSVVWRAEQVGRNVTDEERTKIWDFLVGFEGEHPEGKVGTSKNPKPTKHQKTSSDLSAIIKKAQEDLTRETQLREQLQERVMELQRLVDKVHVAVDTHIGIARSKKRAVADLLDIKGLLDPYVTKD